MLHNRKSVSNSNFPLVFVGKINLNFYYKKMTEKMHDNLQEKYLSNVFQSLKTCKAFRNFEKLGKNTPGSAIVWKCHRKVFVN